MDDKIKAFADCDSNIPHKKTLKGSLVSILVFSIPTALLGTGSKITSIIFLPITLILVIWNISLFFDTEKKRDIFMLFLGISGLYFSFVLMTASYKVISTVMQIPISLILIVLLVYAAFICCSFLLILKLIHNGSYLKHKYAHVTLIGFPCGVLGYLLYENASPYISQYSQTIIMTTILLFAGFIFSFSSVNILKYKYIKQLEKEEYL